MIRPKNTLLESDEVSQVIDQLKSNYKPELILIFGSYSTGKVHRDSDLDILLVKKTNKRPLWRRIEARKSFETDLPVDILVYSPKEFIELKKTSPFVKSLLKEGKIVYQKNKEIL